MRECWEPPQAAGVKEASSPGPSGGSPADLDCGLGFQKCERMNFFCFLPPFEVLRYSSYRKLIPLEVHLSSTWRVTGSEGWWEPLPQGWFGAHHTPYWRPLRPGGAPHPWLMAAGLAREFRVLLLACGGARGDERQNEGPRGAGGKQL